MTYCGILDFWYYPLSDSLTGLTTPYVYGRLVGIMNDNNVSEESKTAAIKTLAIIGFIAAVLLGLWIAINVIQFLPTAFKNLASIADGLYGRGSAFSITTEKAILNAGEPFKIQWTNVSKDGEYTISYQCANGVSVEARANDGTIVSLACGKALTIPQGNLENGKETLELMLKSEKQRFTDVLFTVAFYPDAADTALYEKNIAITVVNATIPQGGVPQGGITPKPTDNNPTSTKPVATKPTTNKPTGYYTVPVTTTTYPISNPNGYTDLDVKLIGVGTISNGVFHAKSTLDTNDEVALQFSVKNIGTKTSSNWTYKVTFPTNDGTYTSSHQSPLLPQERAITTIRFTTDDKTGTETARVGVTGGNDSKSGNNTASKSVKIVK